MMRLRNKAERFARCVHPGLASVGGGVVSAAFGELLFGEVFELGGV